MGNSASQDDTPASNSSGSLIEDRPMSGRTSASAPSPVEPSRDEAARPSLLDPRATHATRTTDEQPASAPGRAGEVASSDGVPQIRWWNPAEVYGAVQSAYQQAVHAIIRPMRDEYRLSELGPAAFRFRGRRFVRHDFVLRNPRGMKLECSHWQPHDEDRPIECLPCVINLHGNSSSRVAAVENMQTVLTLGCTLLAFDSAGSGRSEGEWVTLGWWEKDDLAAVVQHLRESKVCSSIGLWGRSMGAATSLLHAHRDPTIAGMILDSPFADLRQLIDELVDKYKEFLGFDAPRFVFSAIITQVQSSVNKSTGMDMCALKPIADVDKAFIPALFLAGRQDDFVQPHHAKAIYERYGGDKEIMLVDGDHNARRPPRFQEAATSFLRRALQVSPDITLDIGDFRGDWTQNLSQRERLQISSESLQHAMAMAGRGEIETHALSMARMHPRGWVESPGNAGGRMWGGRAARGGSGGGGGSRASEGAAGATGGPGGMVGMFADDDEQLRIALALSMETATAHKVSGHASAGTGVGADTVGSAGTSEIAQSRPGDPRAEAEESTSKMESTALHSAPAADVAALVTSADPGDVPQAGGTSSGERTEQGTNRHDGDSTMSPDDDDVAMIEAAIQASLADSSGK